MVLLLVILLTNLIIFGSIFFVNVNEQEFLWINIFISLIAKPGSIPGEIETSPILLGSARVFAIGGMLVVVPAALALCFQDIRRLE